MGIIWDYATAVFSEYRDGVLGISPDAQGDTSSAVPYEEVQPLGLRSRPRDPDTDANGKPAIGAGLLTALLGHLGFAMPTTDSRALTRIPPAEKGGTCLHSTGPQVGFVNIHGTHGSVLVYVPYAPDASGAPTKSLVLSIDVGTEGQENIQIRHGEGHGITIMNDAKHSVIINNKAGDVTVAVDDEGVKINGNTVTNGGQIIGDPLTAQPLALYNDLATFAAQVTAALSTLAGAAGSMVPAIVVPTALPAPSTKASASP